MNSCIFCSIVSGEQKADVILSEAEYVAFNDIRPKAPVHILIVPKKHIASVAEIKEDDVLLMGQLINGAKKLAVQAGVENSGYKLVFNVGHGGGQVIDHIHLHLLGGWNNEEHLALNV
ncbi:MAG: histidine triad nucleotide-binding protein [Candidatus Terrybacteria bacterium RIFCSPLOWO2_01_FULL_40_23]|uniref:Histidine triad nucleotide-binding protein n=1 Tax=Candidatus Terrybacteria bacterium RIFCSPLOWO2_01_FULL_40_23 TaxID=1802366 RepID=A0A1G2PTY0_9BACT|nr:MAG: histidine triad nucleotide-binding protein [Candidatus Terrybacteria bacterium RIFCSPLOWO2_01_FULL_40_23]